MKLSNYTFPQPVNHFPLSAPNMAAPVTYNGITRETPEPNQTTQTGRSARATRVVTSL